MIERGVNVLSPPNPSHPSKERAYTLFFMTALSLCCAMILSVLASALKEPQERAKEIDRSQQMLIAARILNPLGYFQIDVTEPQGEGSKQERLVPAKWSRVGQELIPSQEIVYATEDQILDVYQKRIAAFLVNDQGQEFSFEQAKINKDAYVQDFRKSGYYKEPYKLIYKIFSNEKIADKEKPKVIGYVIPINGMGLWDAIYGYLAIKPDGNEVIGISWYDQKETPGLGANIAEAEWQSQFPGKRLFQESVEGGADFQSAPLGIVVVKGKVKEVLPNSPKALSAVDGMAGATLTGNGVTNAYRDTLAAYRPFLIRIHQENEPKRSL